MLSLINGPAVVIPRVAFLVLLTLLVILTFGNLYQAGLLSYSQDEGAALDELSEVRKLSCCPCSVEHAQEDADAVQLDLTLSLEQHKTQFSASTLLNNSSSSSSDIAGLESSPEDQHQRVLSSSSSSSESHSSSTAGSATSSSSGLDSGGHLLCEEHAGEHFHQYVALFFLFNIILLGTALLHISAMYPSLQFTVMLFLLGMIVSFFLEGIELKCGSGILGESYVMWMDIDPHLLLFAMLPALLAGDAMTIDTSVARRVSLQCLYLAGPGVVVSAGLIALFLKFYLDWSFLLSLVTASILCATDPVAVVALLKELGASPVLTVQIQGESLLNDGTAIVLYTVAYEMLSGEDYDVAKIFMFLVKTALMACALGAFLGYIFFSWIRLANDRFNHTSVVIQILLTLSAAYWSFIMAEGVMHMSGVLATVSSSLVLAHHMWPHILHKETLSSFWHTLEEMMNIIIFLLAGSLCGAAMVHIEPIDYLHLIVIYLVLTIARGGLIFGSIPLLKHLNHDKMPVSKADAAVMTWGGLRGAVGLALAIQVRRGRATDESGDAQITNSDAQRVLFFVSGIAFLTTTINATTCPLLVKFLGITAFPHQQEVLLRKFTKQIVKHSHLNEHPPEVTESLHEMFHHIEEDIHHKSKKELDIVNQPLRQISTGNQAACQMFEAVRVVFERIPKDEIARLDHPAWSFDELLVDTKAMLSLVDSNPCDEDMCMVINRTFANMLFANYQKQIESGELRPGSPESDILFTSIHYCLSPLTVELNDFEFINHSIAEPDAVEGTTSHVTEEEHLPEDLMVHYKSHGKSENLPTKLQIPRHSSMEMHSGMVQATMHDHFKHIEEEVLEGCRKYLDALVRSHAFAYTCAAAISLNAVCVVADELGRNAENEDHIAWLIAELSFSLFFTIEALLKIMHAPCGYFKDSWNLFDFFLVLVGIAGGIITVMEYMDLHEEGASSTMSQASRASRVIRIARVLRSMRLLRIFILFHAMLSRDKHVSHELAVSMLKESTLTSFVQAHMAAQKQLKRFFMGKVDESIDVEISRCVLQSLTSVHKALLLIIAVQRTIDPVLLEELMTAKETKRLTEDLESFVQEAENAGAISAQEAHAIMHPIQEQLATCMRFITRLDDGVVLDSPQHHHHHHHLEHSSTNDSVTDLPTKSESDMQISKADVPEVCEPTISKESDSDVQVGQADLQVGKEACLSTPTKSEVYMQIASSSSPAATTAVRPLGPTFITQLPPALEDSQVERRPNPAQMRSLMNFCNCYL